METNRQRNRRLKEIKSEDKKKVIRILEEVGIIKDIFTGKILLNINQSGLTDLEKTERFK